MCSIARSLVVLNSTIVVSYVTGSMIIKSINPRISLLSTSFWYITIKSLRVSAKVSSLTYKLSNYLS